MLDYTSPYPTISYLIQLNRFIGECATVHILILTALRYFNSSARVQHINCYDLPSIPEGVEAPTPWSNVP